MGILNWINDRAARALDSTLGRPQFLKDAPRPEEALGSAGYAIGEVIGKAAVEIVGERELSQLIKDVQLVDKTRPVDANKDGQISREEMRIALAHVSIDRFKSGTMTAEEFADMRDSLETAYKLHKLLGSDKELADLAEVFRAAGATLNKEGAQVQQGDVLVSPTTPRDPARNESKEHNR